MLIESGFLKERGYREIRDEEREGIMAVRIKAYQLGWRQIG